MVLNPESYLLSDSYLCSIPIPDIQCWYLESITT